MMISEWMIDNNDPADDSDASRFKIKKTNQITIEMKVKDQCEEGRRKNLCETRISVIAYHAKLKNFSKKIILRAISIHIHSQCIHHHHPHPLIFIL
jgi:hypothetical protein